MTDPKEQVAEAIRVHQQRRFSPRWCQCDEAVTWSPEHVARAAVDALQLTTDNERVKQVLREQLEKAYDLHPAYLTATGVLAALNDAGFVVVGPWVEGSDQ